MAKILFAAVLFTLFVVTFSSKLYFQKGNGRRIQERETRKHGIEKRAFSLPSDLFAPPPEGQTITLEVLVLVTCNDISVDIVDVEGVFSGGSMQAWVFLSTEAPAVEHVNTAPDLVILPTEEYQKVTFDMLFEDLNPCTNYTVYTRATSNDGLHTETTTSIVDTDCPCDDGSGIGDPHYSTFDSRTFTFNGDCTYLLAEDCGYDPMSFHVYARHGTPAGTSTRRVVEVTLNTTIEGKSHSVSVKRDRTCKVDGRLVSGIYFNPNNLEINYKEGSNGKMVVFAPYSKIWIKYDPLNKYEVKVGANSNAGLFGKTCGLLGNNNGNPNDDNLKRDGTPTDDINEFGDSYAVAC